MAAAAARQGLLCLCERAWQQQPLPSRLPPTSLPSYVPTPGLPTLPSPLMCPPPPAHPPLPSYVPPPPPCLPTPCPQERLLAGGVAGAVSRTVVAPLERLRTIMMAVSGVANF